MPKRNAIENFMSLKRTEYQGAKMTWPLSKRIISTDDQTEISGTKETIRKDRMLQKLSQLRWQKPLRDELGKLKREKILSEKTYTFEKHRYETKLKDFKGKRILFLRDKTRKEVNSNIFPKEAKENIKRRMNNIFVNKLSDSTVFLPRKDLKWSLNDTTEKKSTEQEALAPSKVSENALNRDKLPTIYNRRLFEKIKTRQGKYNKLFDKIGKPNGWETERVVECDIKVERSAKQFSSNNQV